MRTGNPTQPTLQVTVENLNDLHGKLYNYRPSCLFSKLANYLMGILGTSVAEEEPLRSAARPMSEGRLSFVSTNPSSLSAYETASEFGDEHFTRPVPLDASTLNAHCGQSLNYEDNDDTETIELAHDDATTPRHSLHLARAPSVQSSPALDTINISAKPDADAAEAEKSSFVRTDTPNHESNYESDLRKHAVTNAYNQEELLSHAQLEKVQTMDDEDLILPVQQRMPLDPSGLSENDLNRVVTERSERGEPIMLERTLTTATHIDVRDLEFDGEDDKANPFNWPSWKKWLVTFTIANTCLCISLGSSLYVAAVPALMKIHHASETLVISGLTFYLVGLALGPAIAAPISEVIGRRWIYVTLFPASMLFAMGVGLAKNIRTILILRFFCGFFASPPMALAGGTITDIWSNSPLGLALAMSLFCLSPFLGPIIGPIVGGFAAEHKNWQWTMWVYLMFSGAVLPFLLACPETFKVAILDARAKKRGINVIKPKFSFKDALNRYLARPLEMLVVEPIVCFTSIYIAFVFAVLFGFFEAYPIIFHGLYRMDPAVSSLPFIGVGVGLVLGVLMNILYKRTLFMKKMKNASNPDAQSEWEPPESQLKIVKVGAILLPISLFWLAWTSRKNIHWIAPTLAGIPFGFGLMWIFLGVISYYAYSFPPAYVASAISANNLLRYLLAAVFPLFVVQMYDKLHIDWATSLFAFISLAMVPIPFIFERYGERIRLKSKYGYVAYFRNLAEEEENAKALAAVTEAAQVPVVAEAKTASLTSSPNSQFSGAESIPAKGK